MCIEQHIQTVTCRMPNAGLFRAWSSNFYCLANVITLHRDFVQPEERTCLAPLSDCSDHMQYLFYSKVYYRLYHGKQIYFIKLKV